MSRKGLLRDRPQNAAGAVDSIGEVKAFVVEHVDIFGHGPDALDRAGIKKDFTARHNGVRTIVWEQTLDNVPIWGAVFIANTTRDGGVASISSQFVTDPQVAADRGMPNWHAKKDKLPISKEMAIAIAQRDLGGGDARTANAKLVWLPTSSTAMRLAWEVHARMQMGGDMYRLLVDAESGEVVVRHLRTFYATPVTYNVFTTSSPAPMAPGLAAPETNQAPFVSRNLVTIAALSTNASPVGWIGDGDTETRGNNVDAHLDRNADDLPDLPRPQAGPGRVFDYPLDLTGSPATYGEATVVNLFYWCNWMHDRLYEYGFDEAAGNYQKDNFGRGGVDNDAVIANAQDGAGVNNARFITAPDGEPGRIEMFTFDGPDPDRDGSLDADVMLHEYTHGMTDRMVGAGIGIFQPVTFGLGEGWSDFYAIALLNDGANLDGNYTEGGYLTYQLFGLTQNYYYGIRRYPYTTDMTKNPLTFKDLDPAQISSYPGVPRSPIAPFNPAVADEPHRMGELWCVTLWEMRAKLIRKYGFPSGNDLTLQIVTDALKLSPPNPTFLQERDAILLADRLLTSGANQNEIWAAFAKRGMGLGATEGPNWTTEGIRESFDQPDTLAIFPVNGLRFSGASGGPIDPGCRVLVITNPGAASIVWSLSNPEPNFTISSSGGNLGPGQGIAIQVCATAGSGLNFGTYVTPLFVTNLTSGVVQRRDLAVQILEIAKMPFVEDFESEKLSAVWTLGGAGLARTSLSTNDGPHGGRQHLTLGSGASAFYGRNEATMAVDLAGYTNVVLRLWAKEFHDRPDGPPPAPFYETADFDGVAISANGYAWYEAAGLRRLRDDYSEVIVPLDSTVAKYGLAYNGQFRIRFNEAGSGPIPENGIAIDDVSIVGIAPRRFSVALPGIVSENAGVVRGQAVVHLPVASTENVIVHLESSDPQIVAVPATVFLSAGATSVSFDLSVIDDDVLDGEQTTIVTASAAGYFTGQETLHVTDNETAMLTLSVDVPLQEGRGLLSGAGRVQLDRAPVNNLLVELGSSDPAVLTVPPGVVISAGATSAVFNVFVGDDGALDGPQTVILTGRLAGGAVATVNATVYDDESTNVFVAIPPLVNEAGTTLAQVGSVRISGTVPTNVIVFLTSSQTNKLRVPPTATILAGRTTVAFNLTLLDDFVAGPPQTVTVSASAAGFGPGQSSMRILDNDDAPFAYNPRPAPSSTTPARDVQLTWDLGVPELIVNGGFENGDFSGWLKETTGGGDFVINSGSIDPAGPEPRSPPYTGRFSAISQQSSPGIRTIYQDVTVPTFFDSAVLNWTHRIRNHAGEFSGGHFFRVEIRAPDNTLLAIPFSTQPGDPAFQEWQEHSFPLQNYRGSTIRIAFVESDSLGFLNVGLDNVRIFLSSPGTVTSEVYFGTTTNLGAAQLVGATTNTVWLLPPLSLSSHYYWQIVTRRGSASAVNPVWQFSARGIGPLDHFTWNPVASNQVMGQPFPAGISAKDADGNTIGNFSRSVSLTAQMPQSTEPVQVLTFTGFRTTTREYRHTLAAISIYFTNYAETFFTGTAASVLEAQLAGKNVFLVVEQDDTPVDQMAALGEEWSPVLKRFLANGGVMIVCSHTRDEHEILNQGGLMQLTKVSPYTSADLQVAFTHPLTEGVAPIFTGANIASYTSADGLAVINVANSTNAVVLTRDYGAGHIVMIGTDYNVNRTPMDRVAANAVRLAQGEVTRNISVAPPFTDYFSNGTWAGNVAVLAVGSNIVITADDREGHVGRSIPLTVTGRNDLSLRLIDAPDPVTLGSNIVYTAQVRNSGPATADGVAVTFQLPARLDIVGITNAQGSCSFSNDTIRCDLGPLTANATAQVIIEAAPQIAGTFRLTATAEATVEDAYADNNTDTATTSVGYPSIFISGKSALEGNSGSSTLTFPIQVRPPSSKTVTVQYASSNITAIAGEDYQAQSGLITFAPGQTNQSVTLTIFGDRLYEGNGETFAVYLFNPTNAILGAEVGTGRIQEDDPAPALSILDTTLVEGADGTTTQAVFAVQLSTNAGVAVTANYSTIGGSASPVLDFLSVASAITMPAGVTSTNITVTVKGDSISETNETFIVSLSSPVNATLGRGQATATILDDDAGELDAFVWNTIPAQQQYGVAFPVTITAKDALGNVAVNFSGPVSVAGWAAARQSGVGPGDTPRTAPMGTYFHDQRVQAIYHPVEVAEASRITALALLIQVPPGQTLNRWTIRMKHSDLDEFDHPIWEQDWTTVYQNNETVISGGWVKFQFTRPFEYNGVQNLLVDFTFNNGTYTIDGQCDTTATPELRVLHFRTDSAFGDPLDWSGTEPPGELARWVPSVQFFTERHIDIAPTNTGPFINGVWTGNISVFDVVDEMSLRADDGRNHSGTANLFRVVTTNDLAITASDTPDPARAGDTVTFTYLITNSGPAAASGISISNPMPPNTVAFSAQPSQGSCAIASDLVTCTLGTIPGSGTATVIVRAVPQESGIITNTVFVSSDSTELFLGNNRASAVTRVNPRAILVSDITVTEGTDVFTNAVFNVRLSSASPSEISVEYFTSDITATNGLDYLATKGVLVFAPGVTNLTVSVPVIGDINDEPTESFRLNLTSPTNGFVLNTSATATILDDDPPPLVTVFDAAMPEGHSGPAFFPFPVRISPPSGFFISVTFTTSNGTATAGSDYFQQTLNFIIPPGFTNRTINTTIFGDRIVEPDETFFLSLSRPQNLTLATNLVRATIINDDGLPGVVENFVWSHVPSPQRVGRGVPVAIEALDSYGNIASNFNGATLIRGRAGPADAFVGGNNSSAIIPFGTSVQDNRMGVIYLASELKGARRIMGLALSVLLPPGQPLNRWTIRLKHTTLNDFLPLIAWETNGWTTVYQNDEVVDGTGWVPFMFQTPFEYNGTNNLMLDFTFDNSYFTVDGQCAFNATNQQRTAFAFSDSEFGDPKNWTGFPGPQLFSGVPVIKFISGSAVEISPDVTGAFTNGLWSGVVNVLEPAADMQLIAEDTAGHLGLSEPFTTEFIADLDSDGLLDAWELAYFGTLDASPNADPDGDGLTNLQEQNAGTNPLDAGSVLRIVTVEFNGADVNVHFTSVIGRTYRLEGSNRLESTQWSLVADNLPGIDGVLRVTDFNAAAAGHRFYRVRLLP